MWARVVSAVTALSTSLLTTVPESLPIQWASEAQNCAIAFQLFGGLRLAVVAAFGVGVIVGWACSCAYGGCSRQRSPSRHSRVRVVERRRALARPHLARSVHGGGLLRSDRSGSTSGSRSSAEDLVVPDSRRRRISALPAAGGERDRGGGARRSDGPGFSRPVRRNPPPRPPSPVRSSVAAYTRGALQRTSRSDGRLTRRPVVERAPSPGSAGAGDWSSLSS